MHRTVNAALLCALALGGCETERDQAQEKVDALSKQAVDAADATKKLADDATQAGKDAIDTTKRTTDKVVATGKDAADKGKALYDSAAKAWADIPGTGELSDTAKGWLASVTDEATIETVVREGTQIAPVALEIGKSLHDAIDSDTAIEPIFQKIEEGDEDKVDAAISDMPRTEVVDGLKIGFKQLDETTNAHMVKERGYLVTWRDGDRLYGFVYHSKRTIDVDKLVADAPRLLGLAKAAVGGA
jgi:hypothetical protein